MRTTILLTVYDRRFARLMGVLATLVLPALLTPGALAQDGGGGGGDVGSGLAALTKLAVDALIVVGALILALGFAFSGVSAQIGAMAGMPYAQASAITRVAALVGFFLLTVFAIPFANSIIDNVSKYKSSEGIHIPK